MTATIVVAIIAAVGSLVVAMISQVGNRRNQAALARLNDQLEQQRQAAAAQLEGHKLEVADELERQRLHLSSELEDERATRDARREYEYRARLRLYQECEPLLFAAVELVERAQGRVRSLSRSAKNGDLQPDGSGWLARPGYYFRSTAFFLLAPATTFKILQRRLTAIDLSLAAGLQLQYELLKVSFNSFTDDFKLAQRGVVLPYDPDRADPGQPGADKLRRTQPETYGRQGLYQGTLDVLVEALVTESKDVPRCKSFGEFIADWEDPHSTLHTLIPDVTELFGGFHPQRRPVLWRVLVFQALLHEVFLQVQRTGTFGRHALERYADIAVRDAGKELDWRPEHSAFDGAVVQQSIEAAAGLLRERLAQVAQRLRAAD
ncbi:MAG: hypothetical protein ACRD12_21440 [Acidimicrobiales bacterium]